MSSSTQAQRRRYISNIVGPRLRQAERRRELDVIAQREGRLASKARQLEVQAMALRRARATLVMPDAETRGSVERERMLLDCARRIYEGERLGVSTLTEIRHGAADMIGVTTIEPASATRRAHCAGTSQFSIDPRRCSTYATATSW